MNLPNISILAGRHPLRAALLACVLLLPAAEAIHAQSSPAPQRPPMSREAAAQRHLDGLALEQRGEELAAFIAHLEAAEDGHPPAQRRLGEIYDAGNAVVERDFYQSIHWYQKAREGGEQIPPPKPRAPVLQ